METTFQDLNNSNHQVSLEDLQKIAEHTHQKVAGKNLRPSLKSIAENSFNKLGVITELDEAGVDAYFQRYSEYMHLSAHALGLDEYLSGVEKSITDKVKLQKDQAAIEDWYQREISEGRYPSIDDVEQKYNTVISDSLSEDLGISDLLEMLSEITGEVSGVVLRVEVVRSVNFQEIEEKVKKSYNDFLKLGKEVNFEYFIKDLVTWAFEEIPPQFSENLDKAEYFRQTELYFRLLGECVEAQGSIEALIKIVNKVGDEDERKSLRADLNEVSERYKALRAKEDSKRCIVISKISDTLGKKVMNNPKYVKLLHKFDEIHE